MPDPISPVIRVPTNVESELLRVHQGGQGHGQGLGVHSQMIVNVLCSKKDHHTFLSLRFILKYTYGVLIVDLLLALVVVRGLSDCGLLRHGLGLLAVDTHPAHAHALTLEYRLAAPVMMLKMESQLREHDGILM